MGMEDATDSFETLMDLISEVPYLLEKSDMAIKSGSVRVALLHSLLTVYNGIEAWQQAHRRASRNAVYWAIPSQRRNPSDDDFTDKLFPFALEFESLRVAIQITFSSTVMLQLLSTSLFLLDTGIVPDEVESMPEDDSLLEQGPTGDYQAPNFVYNDGIQHMWTASSIQREADRLARFLCQSIEYCFRPEMGTLGVQITCHLQLVTKSYFRQIGDERALAWCRNIKATKATGRRGGLQLMRFDTGNTL